MPALRRLIFRGVRRLFALPQGITQGKRQQRKSGERRQKDDPRADQGIWRPILRRERQSEEFRGWLHGYGNLFPNRNEHDGNTFIVEIRHGLGRKLTDFGDQVDDRRIRGMAEENGGGWARIYMRRLEK